MFHGAADGIGAEVADQNERNVERHKLHSATSPFALEFNLAQAGTRRLCGLSTKRAKTVGAKTAGAKTAGAKTAPEML